MDWVSFIVIFLNLLILTLLLIGRTAIKSKIEKSIELTFQTKLENLKNDMQLNRSDFESKLRKREDEISTLRDVIFSGRVNRQSLLDKRKLEAVERVWNSKIELSQYKMVASFMAQVNFDEAAKLAATDESVRKLAETMNQFAPPKEKVIKDIGSEELFVSSIAWAYYSAYKAIITAGIAQAMILEHGLSDGHKLFKISHMQKLVETVFPNHSQSIESYSYGTCYSLLGEIEGNLLRELKNSIDGSKTDEENIEQANAIMNILSEIEKADSSAKLNEHK